MNNLIVITSFTNHSEAEMAKELLMTNEIPSILKADDVGGLGLGQTFIKGVKLLVNESDVSKAKEILGID